MIYWYILGAIDRCTSALITCYPHERPPPPGVAQVHACSSERLQVSLDVLMEERRCPKCRTSFRSSICVRMPQAPSSAFGCQNGPSSSRNVGGQLPSCAVSSRTSFVKTLRLLGGSSSGLKPCSASSNNSPNQIRSRHSGISGSAISGDHRGSVPLLLPCCWQEHLDCQDLAWRSGSGNPELGGERERTIQRSGRSPETLSTCCSQLS